MAKDATSDFTSKIVQVVIALVIVTAVALPIITSATSGLDPEDDATLLTIINIVPVFLILAVLMIVIKMFMGKKSL